MGKQFNKRLYPNLREFLGDLGFILKRSDKMKVLMRAEVIDEQFRERLMMAVTGVNGCRYCSYYHTQLALSAGIDPHELHAMGEQCFEHSPADQQTALLYAQHWVESSAHPDPGAIECLRREDTPEQVELIELCLRTIRVGNLSGNLFDYLLFKLSFGKWGASKKLTGSGVWK